MVFKSKKEIKIGRAKDNHIVLSDMSVSRSHAILYVEDEELYIKDVGSTYGTQYVLNERKYKLKEAPRKITFDDLIYFGVNGPFVVGEIIRESNKKLLPEKFNEWKLKISKDNYPQNEHVGNLSKIIDIMNAAALVSETKEEEELSFNEKGKETRTAAPEKKSIAKKAAKKKKAKIRCKHCGSIVLTTDLFCSKCEGKIG